MKEDDWALVCTPCREAGTLIEWAGVIKLEAVGLHFEMEHPGQTIAFSTEWRGKGPKPPPHEPNRAQRRAAARKKGRR